MLYSANWQAIRGTAARGAATEAAEDSSGPWLVRRPLPEGVAAQNPAGTPPASEAKRETRSRVAWAPVILCIDDEALGLEIRKIVLEREGYIVLTAGNGRTGIEMFRRQRVDAVILDLSMPEMPGDQVAAELRALRPDLPILLLSGRAETPVEMRDSITLAASKGEGAQALLDNVRRILDGRGDHG